MLLPIINRTYINKSSLHDILETTIKINEFESTQKVLKYLISNAKESKSILVKEDKFAGLTLEQINVLKEHGLDEHFWYNSVERKDVIPEGERDFYETRAMSFTIKDFSGLPKVQDVLLKMNESKKLTPSVALMGRVYNDIYKFGTSKKIDMKKPNVKLRDFLEEQLNDTKNSLRVCRAQLASQKLAKLVTGDWFKGIEIDAKGKEFYAEDETIMYIKTKRERVYL
jgi:hypothetical protein